jgi:glycosyltransferase involved in cell wall biosynthesis
LVSVVIPCHNAGPYIRQAVSSILSQSFTDFELIIVDDASTDESLEVVRQFSDSRIRLFENDVRSGISRTRNRGLEEARGQYIAVLDADDISHPERLEKQVLFLDRNPEFGMVGSRVRLMNHQSERLSEKWRLGAHPDAIPSILLFKNYFCHSAVMMRRDAIPPEGYDPALSIGEDHDLWIKITRKRKALNLPLYLTSYRIHGGSVVQRNPGLMTESEKEIFCRAFLPLGFTPDARDLELLLALKYPAKNKGIFILDEVGELLCRILAANESTRCLNQRELRKIVFLRWLRFLVRTHSGNLLRFKQLFRPDLFRHITRTAS